MFPVAPQSALTCCGCPVATESALWGLPGLDTPALELLLCAELCVVEVASEAVSSSTCSSRIVAHPEVCVDPGGGCRLGFFRSKLSTTGTTPSIACSSLGGTVTMSAALNQVPAESFPDKVRYLAALWALPPKSRIFPGRAKKAASHLKKSSNTSLPSCPRKQGFVVGGNICAQPNEATRTSRSKVDASIT